VHAFEELQKVARADVDLGPGEDRPMGTGPQVQVQMVLPQRVRRHLPFRGRQRTACPQDSRLLLRERRPDLGEAVAEHAVHGPGHVLDPATVEHLDTGVGMGCGQLGDLAQGVEVLGQLADHDRGSREQLGGQR